MSKIQEYIVKNWKTLPKSSFNDEEAVMFDTVENYDGGWGHHSYEGYGVKEDGTLISAFSSGCSCDGGSCYTSNLSYNVSKESQLMFDNYEPEEIDFQAHEVCYSDY